MMEYFSDLEVGDNEIQSVTTSSLVLKPNQPIPKKTTKPQEADWH